MEVVAILTKKRNFSKFYTKGYNLIETNNTNTFFFNRHFCTSNFIPWTLNLEKKKIIITNEIQTLFFILTVISFFPLRIGHIHAFLPTCLEWAFFQAWTITNVYRVLRKGKGAFQTTAKTGYNAWYFLRISALVVLLCFQSTTILIIIIMFIINIKTHVSAQDDFQKFYLPTKPNFISN